ncbi:MAG TPA: hypothetical protein VHL30_01545 [Chlamydiales bacterium]|jgi:hypothetical protein|nr:hypothetical protein [Chlamydiales bacterium]
MTLPVSSQPVRVSSPEILAGTHKLVPKLNEKAQNSGAKKVHDFVSSAYGTYRFTQLPGKIANVVIEGATLAGATEETIKPVKDVAKVFNTAANGMIWGYWLWSTFEVGDQVSKVIHDKEADGGDVIELVRVSTDWVTAGCHSLSTVLPSIKSTFGSIARFTDPTVDTIESVQAGGNLWRVSKLLSKDSPISEAVRKDLESEKSFQCIALAKSVIAAVAGIFAAFLPPLVLAITGLTVLLLALAKHFYRENMHAEPLSKWAMELIPA